MTREEIGSYLGLKLETVSRTFSKFVDEGIVEVKQRHIRILDTDALKRIVALKLAQVAKRLRFHYGLDCRLGDSLHEALVAACLLPDMGARNIDSLLNEQILPVLSQQLLERRAAQQRCQCVSLEFSEEQGICLSFTDDDAAPQTAIMEA